MPDYTRLPGVIVRINDGGLAVPPPVSTSPRILILGTASKGPAYTPIEVTNIVTAGQMFGSTGTLLPKAMEAISSGAENITLYRMGSTPSYISQVGIGVGTATSGDAGVTVVFENHSPTISTDYMIAYKSGILKIYTAKYGTQVYSNDPTDPVDLGLVTVSGTVAIGGGDALLTDVAGDVDIANAILVSDIPTGYITEYTAGWDGVSMTKRQLFEQVYTAFALLDGYDSDIVMIAGATVDNPNVAYYDLANVEVHTEDAINDPRSSANSDHENVLGWLRVIPNNESASLFDYYWSECVAATTGTLANSGDVWTAETLADKTGEEICFTSNDHMIASDFHEVCFGWLLANYCYQMTKNNNEMFGVMAIKGPSSAKLFDLNKWVGYSPTYNTNGVVISDGTGLLGFPMTMGCSNSRLNNLVRSQGYGRSPGYFATDSEYKDGNAVTDDNGYKIDIGAYLNIVGEYPLINIGSVPYVGPIDALYCGMISRLDQKSGTTFKPVSGLVRQRYKLSKEKHDNLCQAKIVMMDQVPVKGYAIVDGCTAACDGSDFRRLTSVRILHLVSQLVRKAVIPFIGEAALDSIRRAGLSTALDAVYSNLAKRGYLEDYRFNIQASKYDQVLGRVFIFHTFIPALETRRITNTYQFHI